MANSGKNTFSAPGRGAGYRFKSANPNATRFKASRGFDLPQKVDLRPLMTPVENQGNLNSCTANAIAGAYEYLLKKHLSKPVDVSRLFIYYNARRRDDSVGEDEGSVIQYGMESLKKYGACHERLWPYDEDSVLEKPTKQSYTEASKFRALDMQLVEVELDQWRKALAEGFPVVFGCVLFDSFDDCENHKGVVPMPSAHEVKRGEHGNHAMLCVGYSDIDRVFIVRNSWGKDWGVSGYCYMPYDYLMNAKFNGGDCWVLRSAGNLPNPQETWVADGASILTELGALAGGFLNSIGNETYDDVEHEFFSDDEEWTDADQSGDEDEGDEEGSWVEDDEDYDEDVAEEEEVSEDEEEETSEEDEETSEDEEEETSEEDEEVSEDEEEETSEEDEEASEDEEEETSEEDEEASEDEEDEDAEEDEEEEDS